MTGNHKLYYDRLVCKLQITLQHKYHNMNLFLLCPGELLQCK